jgi:SAM-dependent methyltransferase
MSLTKQATFYDEHPFDWVESYPGEERRRVISPLLLKVIDALPRDALVLDVGCGPGRVLSYLGHRGLRCVGLDRSAQAIAMVAQRHRLPGIVGDNRSLPLRGEIADLVISDGVLHHTGDPPKAFAENCRIVRHGGLFYLAVYRPGGRYEFLYKYPGWFMRLGVRSAATRWLVHSTALPLYYLAHRLTSGGKVTWDGAKNLFYDYFASPEVAFLPRQTIEKYAVAEGMQVVSYDANPKQNVHCFVLRKTKEHTNAAG